MYDRVNKWGGAERVLLALHELFPDAPLYTSVYNAKKAPWADVFTVRTSFLQYFPFASSFHELYAVLMPLAFEHFSFDNYDLVISVTSEAAKGIITSPSTFHLCYCLTPTRYLWSGYDVYFAHPWFRFLTKPLVVFLQKWDRKASQRPDGYIAISQEVRERIKKYYNRDADVVYPPAGLEVSKGEKVSKVSNGGYFLVVSRLVAYKCVDLAILACNALQLPLVIVGSGSEEGKLRSMAGKTTRFVHGLTDEELLEYYNGCRALLFPGLEDFGLSIVEAQQMGKPVIAYKAGGVLETIVDKKTGILFDEQSEKSLIKALRQFETKTFDRDIIKKNGERFSKKRFEREFRRSLTHKKL